MSETAEGVDTTFWDWFATSLQTVAGKAYHRGWMDREFIADNPDLSFPSEDWHREAYTGTGFEPEYVGTLYTPPFGFTQSDVTWLRLYDEVSQFRSLADRIESLLASETSA